MVSKTALFARNQPGGVFDYVSIFQVQGDAWFVDAGNSSASDSAGYGHNPDAPFATLDYAMDSTNGVTANNGDVVFLLPGHTETLSASNRPVLDRAGVRVIGLGSGADRPTFTYSAQADCITISGASVSLENVLITCTGTIDFTKAISVTGADAALKDVEVRCSAADSEFAAGVYCGTGADRLHVDGYRFYGLAAGDAQATAIFLNGDDNSLIENCVIHGNHATACIELKTTASLNLVVRKCSFYNAGSSALSLLIVNTGGTASTWAVYDCFDMTSGVGFSGGSGQALEGSDVSTLSDLVGLSTSTQTSDLHGKVGTDAEMADRSLYDLLVGAGPVTAPSSAAPASDVSLYEVASAIYDDTAVIGAATSTETDNVCGKLGTDAELGDRSVYDLLNGGGPVTAATAAAHANNVSLYGAVGYVSDNLGVGTSTETDNLCGKVGTDAEMADRSVYDLLAGDGPVTAPSAAAAANDVSLYEVLRYVSEKQLPRLVTYTATDMSTGWTTGTKVLFTVTGDVLCRCWGVVGTNIASTNNDGTISLGTAAAAGNATSLIAAATADGTSLQAGDVWFDATSGVNSGVVPLSGAYVAIGGGADIVATIATHEMTAGGLKVYCQWIPASSDGAVVAAA